MSKPGLSFGLNLTKKHGSSKGAAAPPKRKPMFGQDDDDGSDDDTKKEEANGVQNISELDDFPTRKSDPERNKRPAPKSKRNGPPTTQPPNQTKKAQQQPISNMYGDLSSALESKRYQQAAEELDPSIYDYDAVYDTLKPTKEQVAAPEDVEKRPKYMKSLMESAATRRRDALIAEEKKIAREREQEGEEYADKEKFVTEAYKKQQEENRRIEEEERRREEEEAKNKKGGGMTAFYKDLLERGDRRHAEVVRAADERAKMGPEERRKREEEERKEKEGGKEGKGKTATDMAREINAKGGSIAINEDGEVVDKRELLKGGLNVAARKKPEPKADERKGAADRRDDPRSGGGRGLVSAGGGKQAMRERQSRMLESQLEQSLKRTLDQEAEEQAKVEHASKSRKTDKDISSAKERYLARKRAAAEEEEKKKKKEE